MSRETQSLLIFHPLSNLIRAFLAGMLLIYLKYFCDDVKEPASIADREWSETSLSYLILYCVVFAFLGFFGVMKVLYVTGYVMGSLITAGQGGGVYLAFFILRFGFASIAATITQIRLGFELDSTLPEDAVRRDSKFLLYLRILLTWGLVLFAIYLIIANVVLCWLSGLDGSNIRNPRNLQRFKRIPYGSLFFSEGNDCGICLEKFKQNTRVVQLTCHEKHIFHRSCLSEMVRNGNMSCPYCRQPIQL